MSKVREYYEKAKAKAEEYEKNRMARLESQAAAARARLAQLKKEEKLRADIDRLRNYRNKSSGRSSSKQNDDWFGGGFNF